MTEHRFSSVRGLTKHFAPTAFGRGPVVRALEDISFDVGARRGRRAGRRIRLAARPRSAARVLRLIEPTAGEVRFDGTDTDQAVRGRAATAAARACSISSRIPSPACRRA